MFVLKVFVMGVMWKMLGPYTLIYLIFPLILLIIMQAMHSQALENSHTNTCTLVHSNIWKVIREMHFAIPYIRMWVHKRGIIWMSHVHCAKDVCRSRGSMYRRGIVLGLENVNLDQRYVGHIRVMCSMILWKANGGILRMNALLLCTLFMLSMYVRRRFRQKKIGHVKWILEAMFDLCICEYVVVLLQNPLCIRVYFKVTRNKECTPWGES